MNKFSLILIFTFFYLTTTAQNSMHDFKVKKIDGTEISMSEFKGKKLMLVNVASKCGLTPQYAELEEIYKKYGGDKFEIIGFPANNFGGQEPGTDEEILTFCTSKFGVTFTMMSKISVKGKDQAPLYKWLTTKEENGVESTGVDWNFQKYLINADGTYYKKIGPQTLANHEDVIKWIEDE